MNEELQNAREDYQRGSLSENELNGNPVQQFELWFNQYKSSGVADYNAMVLSTINNSGKPASRVVLLKGIDQGGFEFYTNYSSSKGQDIKNNPAVALNFFWPSLERQVRVEGRAFEMSARESDAYFKSRPLGSRLGAWVSPQSAIIPDRKYLENRLEEIQRKYGEDIPRPDHWGGYRVIPEMMEFWQGRSNRLHDRIMYTRTKDGWKIDRLAP